LYTVDRGEAGTTTARRFATVEVVPLVAREVLVAVEDDEPHAAKIRAATAHDATTTRRHERAAIGED
jgi:hypothetical protein